MSTRSRIGRNVVICSIMLISLLATGLGAAASAPVHSAKPVNADPAIPHLIVLVRFAADPGALGITPAEAATKIEADLRAELGSDIDIVIKLSDDAFIERFQTAFEALAAAHNLPQTETAARAAGATFLVGKQDQAAPLIWDAATQLALDAHSAAHQSFADALKVSTNLAALSVGAIGLFVVPADGYGGQTVVGDGYPHGERWSFVYTGLALRDFDVPGDPAQTRNYILQYLANSAKQQIGLQFGLRFNFKSLDDAMRTAIDRSAGEHLQRDSQPVHYNPEDLALLQSRLHDWAAYSLFLPRQGQKSAPIATLSRLQLAPSLAMMQTSTSSRDQAGWDPIISKMSEGPGVVAGAAGAPGWGAGLASGGDTANISTGFRQNNLDAELGLSYRLDYETRFRFVDHAGRDAENAFFELYVVANNDVIYYHRYPESGYISNPDAWFDNSISQDFLGSIYLGAKDWPCLNITGTVHLHVVAWRDDFQWHGVAKSHWVGIDDNGKEINGTPVAYYRTAGLTRLSQDDQLLKITVHNPYFVAEKLNDNGKTKQHQDGPFALEFDATMDYRFNYPGITVILPQPSTADVTVNPLVAKDDWTFNLTKGDLQFKFLPGVGAQDAKTIGFGGRHGDLAFHHPSQPATYADDWGADVAGQNHIFVQEGSTAVAKPYAWAAHFRSGPDAETCTPLQFAVTCVDPGIQASAVAR